MQQNTSWCRDASQRRQSQLTSSSDVTGDTASAVTGSSIANMATFDDNYYQQTAI
jgi:hypothetical protein